MKLRLPALLVAAAFFTSASAELQLLDRMLLHSNSLEMAGRINSSTPARKAPYRNAEHRTFVFIRLHNGADASELEQFGFDAASQRDGILIGSVPTSQVEALAAHKAVKNIEISQLRRPQMAKARISSGVDKIHAGEGFSHPFTGKGVVVGIVDQGLDANHINFVDEEGVSRIGYLGHIRVEPSSPSGWVGEQYGRENIPQFATDYTSTFHATHTLGILAGSYKGEVEAAVAVTDSTAELKKIDNPYYGVAYEADIAATCGDLQDMLIAQGIERILDYRYYKNEPGVISLSLGSNTGAHTSESLMCQYLDAAAKEAHIVISAGNEGDIPLAVRKTLTETDTLVRSFIVPNTIEKTNYGKLYMYSAEPFEMQAVVFNRKRGQIALRMPVNEGQAANVPQYYCTPTQQNSSSDIMPQQLQTAFKDAYVGIGWKIDEYTGQYLNMVDFYTVDNPDKNSDSNYVLGYVVTGKPGQHIECYCDGVYSELSSLDVQGWDNGSCDGTISDLACGKNVLVVGAYNTSPSYFGLDGKIYDYNGKFPEGKVTVFSSWGTLEDGRSLPHVCAPGATIISSMSSYFVETLDNGVGENAVSAVYPEIGVRNNYWGPALGTSMATPFVAGSIALWLQADPTLTMPEIKEIIAKTAVRDNDVAEGNPVQWGAGKFNAFDGLKEVLRQNSVTTVNTDDQALIVSNNGGEYSFCLPAANGLDVKLYSSAGQLVASASSASDQLTVNTSALTPGIYIATINGKYSYRLAIK